MGDQLVHPNLHVALIHFPMGLFAVGLLIELLGFLYSRSAVRPAARWMIALGALLMVPTALSGIYALGDVARRSLPADGITRHDAPWVDVVQHTQLAGSASSQSETWPLLIGHIWRTAPAAGLAVLGVMIAIASGHRLQRWTWRIPVGLILLAALAAMFWGAWMGGELVHRHGVAVGLQKTPPPTLAAHAPLQPGAAREQTEVRTPAKPSWYAPPLQWHMVGAGVATAAVLATIALALRNVFRMTDRVVTEVDIKPAEKPAEVTGETIPMTVMDEGFRAFDPSTARPGTASQQQSIALALNPSSQTIPAAVRQGQIQLVEHAPAGKVGLWAAVLVLLAAVGGAWFLAVDTDAAARASKESRSLPVVLWDTVRVPAAAAPLPAGRTYVTEINPLDLNRRLSHVILGAAILVFTLILAAVARWMPGSRVAILALSILILGLLTAQVLAGTLLALDGPAGPILRLQMTQ